MIEILYALLWIIAILLIWYKTVKMHREMLDTQYKLNKALMDYMVALSEEIRKRK